ncbi:putative MFS siderophore transporter MirB-like protein, partial [Aureobasidium melanogenum]
MPSALRRKFFASSIDPQEGSSTSASTTEFGTAEMHVQDPERYAPHGDSKHAQNEVTADQASEEVPNEDAQAGVTQAEAITLSWTKSSMIATYALMWSIYCVNAFQSNITSNLSPYITSGFEAHSLLPVISIISSIMGAATYMPLAKVLNLWDRTVGLLLMLVFFLLGLILSATCNGIGTYCAAQVFYAIGSAGLIFCVDVVTIDTSTLRSRGLAYALTSSPFIITAYAGPAAAEQFYATNWRWGYGTFCIVLPCVVLPFFGLLRYFKSKAKKNGLLKPKAASGRTFKQSVWYYIIEFDVLGVFLLTAGLALFLLPFTIAGSAEEDWKTPHIIVMLVIGFCCLIAFALAERFLAPVPFLPWELLANRTVIGACLIDATYQISYYCWNDYFTSYLQVVFGTSIATAGYIGSIFDVVSGVWLFCVGFAIKGSRRFRWLLWIAVPLYILGIGLMIYFRKPDFSVGYTIMCQIFIAFAGGTMIICQQVAVLSASDHNNAAAALAFLNVFGNIGGGIGGSISGAVWQHTLPSALQKYLPADALADWETIYEDLDTQLSYPMGDPVRDAIIKAYAIAQSRMLIAGTCIMATSLVWMFIIKDVKLTKKQTKGVLF